MKLLRLSLPSRASGLFSQEMLSVELDGADEDGRNIRKGDLAGQDEPYYRLQRRMGAVRDIDDSDTSARLTDVHDCRLRDNRPLLSRSPLRNWVDLSSRTGYFSRLWLMLISRNTDRRIVHGGVVV